MKEDNNIEEVLENIGAEELPPDVYQVAEQISKDFEKNLTKSKQPKHFVLGDYIMKTRFIKIAAAAVIIALVVLGLFEFIGTEMTSGVVWAEVVKKVGASRGLIVRCTDLGPSSEDDYSITYTSPAYCRKDFYEDGRIIRIGYVDFTNPDTATLTDVFHKLKLHVTTTYKKSENGLFLEWRDDWTSPGFLVQAILSSEHRKLGRKTIEGILCEGIETTDPACFGPLPGEADNLQAEFRLWVNVETGYPVLYESKMSGEHEGQVFESESVMDQFQWDVELDSNIFEPNIPPDYEGVTRPGIVEP
jgi:hypothetical protein